MNLSDSQNIFDLQQWLSLIEKHGSVESLLIKVNTQARAVMRNAST
jgi:hypothetical protein